MNDTQRNLITGGAILAALLLGAAYWSSRPDETPVAPKAVTVATGSKPEGSTARREAPPSAATASPSGSPGAPPEQTTAAPGAPAGEGHVYTEAEIALPPELPDAPGTDLCAANEKAMSSAKVAQALIDRMPAASKDSLGAARLAAMRDRLTAAAARRQAAMTAAGQTCPGK